MIKLHGVNCMSNNGLFNLLKCKAKRDDRFLCRLLVPLVFKTVAIKTFITITIQVLTHNLRRVQEIS